MARANILKSIFNSFSPHKDGLYPVDELKKSLEEYFGLRVFPVNSGRSAIYVLLKAAGIGEGDEVIIQAYTCNAVPNPVLWAGATPVYADIDSETLNVDPRQVEKKVGPKTKAVVLQHTFGRPGPIQEVLEIARKNNLLVIEDCAHALGGRYGGKLLGTFGDAAILSFGREKVISSLAGGAIIIKNEFLMKSAINITSQLVPVSKKRVGEEFVNYLTWRALLRRIYFNEKGYRVIKELNKYDFFNVVTSEKEKRGEKPSFYPATMPNVFAQLALDELPNLEKYNKARQEIADFYHEQIKNPDFKLLAKHEGVYLRVVAMHKGSERVFKEAREKRHWFGNWYNSPVYPKGVDEEALGYKKGSCPVAEKAANETINLPNYLGMSLDEAERVVEFINNFR